MSDDNILGGGHVWEELDWCVKVWNTEDVDVDNEASALQESIQCSVVQLLPQDQIPKWYEGAIEFDADEYDVIIWELAPYVETLVHQEIEDREGIIEELMHRAGKIVSVFDELCEFDSDDIKDIAETLLSSQFTRILDNLSSQNTTENTQSPWDIDIIDDETENNVIENMIKKVFREAKKQFCTDREVIMWLQNTWELIYADMIFNAAIIVDVFTAISQSWKYDWDDQEMYNILQQKLGEYHESIYIAVDEAYTSKL